MSTDQKTLEAYDAAAERYTEMMKGAEKPELDALIEALGPGAEVLDLGCGPGVDMERMAAHGLVPQGLEPTPAFVARGQAEGLDIREGSFEDLDETDRYDAVWASFSLLHAPRDVFGDHLARIHKALRPGGRFVLGMKTGTGEDRDALGRQYTYYTVPELAQALQGAGFSLAEIREGREAGLAGSVDPFAVITAHA